jgi:surface protein
MFKSCSSIKSLPDISKWNTKNVKDMSEMFFGCYSLTSLPDISKWKKTKSCKIINMFFGCDSLKSIPDFAQNDEIAEDYIKKIKTFNIKGKKDEVNEIENKVSEIIVDDNDNKERELEGIDYEDDFNYFDSIYSSNTISEKLNEKDVDMKNVIPLQSKKNIILYIYCLYSNYLRSRFSWKIKLYRNVRINK